MKKNKKIFMPILIIIVGIIIVIGSTYAWYQTTQTGGSNIIKVGEGISLVLTSETTINITNSFPMTDEYALTADNIDAYTFSLQNQSSQSISYTISVEDIETTLSKSVLRYAISINDGEYSAPTSFNISEINTGETINNSTTNFALKIWVASDTPNSYMNTLYSGRIKVDSVPIEPPLYDDFHTTEGVNKPKLATGMTAIKYNTDTSEWNTVSNPEVDTSWYDYANKKWANAITADGSFWVWIPRFAYQIATGYHSDIAGTINVKFLIDDTNTTIDNTIIESEPIYENGNQTNYIKHPAFTFGTEITGFWVAKFEPTAAEGIASFNGVCQSADNTTSKTVKIIPYATAWKCVWVEIAYLLSLNMKDNTNVYGWSSAEVNTHLMKNVEWGAMAYLSKSAYGKETEGVWRNPHGTLTGCAGNEISDTTKTTCNQYHTENGVKASTTGTIYGVYDTNGLSSEYVSAYVNNGRTALNNGSSIVAALSKYKDVYNQGTSDDPSYNYAAAINKKGDAIYETSNSSSGKNSWYGGDSSFPNWNTMWMVRGGENELSLTSGIFSFNVSSGVNGYSISFRPVVLVGSDL